MGKTKGQVGSQQFQNDMVGDPARPTVIQMVYREVTVIK